MWFVYALIHFFTIALVHYLDEYLTLNNKVTEEASSHKQIGGLILISTLMSVVTIVSLYVYLGDVSIESQALYLALASGVPMVVVWTMYFYLFLEYPAHQVVPLFGLSSLWLLTIELLSGASITLLPLIGIGVLVYGSYLLDSGTFKWKTPTKLLLMMGLATFLWAIVLFLVRVASGSADVLTIFFYQYVTVGIIGVLLTVLVAPYRQGFMHRIRTQGTNFLGFSLINEVVAQVSFLFLMLAVALAPLGALVTALGGIQSIFLLMIFFLFPIHERSRVSGTQWLAVALIVMGIFMIEFWKQF